ncbi:unnamed protein product [Arabidopsis arenosa]|uniref:CCHC-type domain-containing protein n=1 Tax=Arabidopsis arenosa TaxID=38785 RepID=A0A8S2ACG8_ARAAE|nr:unnamed protein product [Arabidopsis arenosa]
MPSRHTRLLGGRLWGFPSNAGPSNMYGNSGDSSDDSVIPSEHVRRMLEGSESESFMATSPSVTSVESICTRKMVGSDSSFESDQSEDPEEFEDIVETSVESDEVVPLVDLGGNLGSVPVSDFVMATGFLFGDSDIDEPMWEGPDGVLYEFNSDDSWQPGVHVNPYYYPPSPDSLLTLDSFSSMSLGTDFGVSDAPSEDNASRDSDSIVFLPTEYGIPRQALAYNMVPPNEVFATPPGPPSPDFVELSSDDELADAEESGTELPIPNFVKAESLRMSTPPRRFATRTWYPGYHGEEGVESSHMNLENHVGDQEVPDATANCETLFATPPRVEKLEVLFPPNETLYEPTIGLSSLDAMIQNMIAAGTLGVEPIRPPEGMPIWNERMRRSADGTIVTELEREDGRRSEPYSVTSFCFTCGQNGHYPRTCPYVHHYHPYARPYVVCFECGDEGHYASVCPRKYSENPGPSSPSPSASARKSTENLSAL